MAVSSRQAHAIDVRELPFRHAATVRETIDIDELTERLDRMVETVMDAIGLQGLAATGPPFARLHGPGALIDISHTGHDGAGASVDVEAGIPLAQPIDPTEHVRADHLPAGPALHLSHEGARDTLPMSRRALRDYVVEHALTANGDGWECYPATASGAPHPERCCVELFLPIEPPK